MYATIDNLWFGESKRQTESRTKAGRFVMDVIINIGTRKSILRWINRLFDYMQTWLFACVFALHPSPFCHGLDSCRLLTNKWNLKNVCQEKAAHNFLFVSFDLLSNFGKRRTSVRHRFSFGISSHNARFDIVAHYTQLLLTMSFFLLLSFFFFFILDRNSIHCRPNNNNNEKVVIFCFSFLP